MAVSKIKVARVQLDLTQQQLAEKVGVTRQTISLIEKGKYNPSLDLCLKICYAVDKTLNDLFWEEKGGRMKIVKDERLMIEGLKHIRLAFILQNIVILAIVFYRYVLQGAGYESVSDLLMVFMGGIIIINF